jgi:hypothetical protein
MGFRPLQHFQDRSPRVDGFAGPPRSTCRVWLPSWRIPSATPCRFCFTPTALLGFALRRFFLQRGSGVFPPGWTHLPFHASVFPLPKAVGRPNVRRLLGFIPRRSPWRSDRGLACRPLEPPLGFVPSRVLHRRPGRGLSARDSSHALCSPSGKPPDAPAPQSLDRSSTGSVRPAARRRQPHRATL